MNEDRKTGHLLTEKLNPRTTRIDECSTSRIIQLISEEDGQVAKAVSEEKEKIAGAVDLIVERLREGGRLFFAGAGTSGRLGVIEAAECPPTFGTDPELVQAVIAGGKEAVWRSIEGAEDSKEDARSELDSLGLSGKDVVVGIAASASTPFVEGALSLAEEKGCGRIMVTCNPGESPLASITINLLVGPEVIVGSTRMKAGTATKMVLNMLTTASMIRLGKTYGNLMVEVQPRSAKLVDRAKRIVMNIAEVGEEQAEDLLDRAGWNVKIAVVMEKKKVSREGAEGLLKKHDGFLREALN